MCGANKAHHCSQCISQPHGDFSSMLLYLSDDIVSAPLPLHPTPGVRRCSAIALRLGGGCLCSLDDHLQVWSSTKRSYSRHQRIHVLRGGIAAIPSFPLFSLLNFSCSCRYFISISFERTTDGTGAQSRARGRRSSRCQRVPLRAEYPHLPLRPASKRNSRRHRHVMGECANAKGCRKRP